jgi:cathepsin L
MRLTLAVLLALVAGTFAAELSLLEKWNAFKQEHGKKYASHQEELYRLNVWSSNADFVEKHNAEADAGKHTFWVKMNKFGDLLSHEFVRIYNGFNNTMREAQSKVGRKYFKLDENVAVPDSIDWRTQGYVTPVKDQGQCGSCWSFSATGSLEGQHFKAAKTLASLSEQNLVDCSGKFGNQGCNGGLMDQAFQYIKANNGIDSEESYPYEAVDGQCRFDAKNVASTDSGFVDIKSKDEDELKNAVGTVGPVSVAIDASHASFQLYSHGIYHEIFCSQTRLDHGVLAVGYGSESGQDYWLVKNSWAATWGDQGYIKMSRNRKNNCGIATAASYPTV